MAPGACLGIRACWVGSPCRGLAGAAGASGRTGWGGPAGGPQVATGSRSRHAGWRGLVGGHQVCRAGLIRSAALPLRAPASLCPLIKDERVLSPRRGGSRSPLSAPGAVKRPGSSPQRAHRPAQGRMSRHSPCMWDAARTPCPPGPAFPMGDPEPRAPCGPASSRSVSFPEHHRELWDVGTASPGSSSAQTVTSAVCLFKGRLGETSASRLTCAASCACLPSRTLFAASVLSTEPRLPSRQDDGSLRRGAASVCPAPRCIPVPSDSVWHTAGAQERLAE